MLSSSCRLINTISPLTAELPEVPYPQTIEWDVFVCFSRENWAFDTIFVHVLAGRIWPQLICIFLYRESGLWCWQNCFLCISCGKNMASYHWMNCVFGVFCKENLVSDTEWIIFLYFVGRIWPLTAFMAVLWWPALCVLSSVWFGWESRFYMEGDQTGSNKTINEGITIG